MERDSLFGGLPAPSSASASEALRPHKQQEPHHRVAAAAATAAAAELPSLKSSLKRPPANSADNQEDSKSVRFKTTIDANEDQILGAMLKICVHIGNPAKFSKASKLALQLLEAGSVTKTTADQFFEVLKAAMVQPDQATDYTLRADYLSLFDAVQEKLDCFSQVHHGQIEVWLLWAKVANDLSTDDTFVFSKAASCVRQVIGSLPDLGNEENTEEMEEGHRPQEHVHENICRQAGDFPGTNAVESDPFGLNALLPERSKKNERSKKRREEEAAIRKAQQDVHKIQREKKEALLKCLKIAADRYKHPWAQTIIDITVKFAFDNINKFNSLQREAIEKLWVSVREQQLRRKQGRSSSGKLDVTAFERLQQMYAGEKISIRRAVGSAGDRTAEQWLG